ncbi:MAG: hypothetical protein ACM65L_15840 [Microcoleus sp.]
MKTSQSQSLILWRQVGGVAALQGAITLTWMLYRLYLPQLLAGFGFAGFDRGITILEDSLAIAIEPFAGWLSDKQRHWMGTRFPLIVVATILSSVIFMAIPAIFIFGNPVSPLRWMLPCGNCGLGDRHGDVSIARRVAVGPICNSNAVAPRHEFIGACGGIGWGCKTCGGGFYSELGAWFCLRSWFVCIVGCGGFFAIG